MSTSLRALEGLTVRSIRREDGCLQVEFERGVGLSIYNRCSLRGIDDGVVEELEGAVVERASETKTNAQLEFSGGRAIEIDLRDDAFNGPEAMQLTIPGEPTVVWN
jgi:hypothetical protein